MIVYNSGLSRHGQIDLARNPGPVHPQGWAIAKRIQQVFREAFHIQQGSLYPARHDLEQQGWIKAEWRLTEAWPNGQFYSLTRAGHMKQETKKLDPLFRGRLPGGSRRYEMCAADKARLRLRSLLRRQSVEREFVDELCFHLDNQMEENLASRMSPGEARRAALLTIRGIR